MSRPTSITARRMDDEFSYAYTGPTATAPTTEPAPTPAPVPPAPPAPPEPTPEPAPEITYRAYAGAPGYFMGGPIPASWEVLNTSNIAAYPAADWADGDYVVLGDGTQWAWDGTGWVQSVAEAELP